VNGNRAIEVVFSVGKRCNIELELEGVQIDILRFSWTLACICLAMGAYLPEIKGNGGWVGGWVNMQLGPMAASGLPMDMDQKILHQ
jgi:hypothetical protein